MYKIYADETLIYDSTIEDYKINKGVITLETNKSGSFSFSLYPDHFYYDKFVKLKTVITVYKSNKIVFRGRILNDTTDHWNNKSITCEGELGFLQDSIIRPFSFTGTPEQLFKKFINEHNSQVDEFKRFKIGTVTVVDPNNYIARSNSSYETSLSNLNSRLIEDSLGGYFYITHGEDGTDTIPTINYLADFTKVSSQKIEFGVNLKNYVKTTKAEEIATAIIPLGKEVDDGDDSTENKRLTISSVNGGKDYVYSEAGVKLRGWIFKVVSWDDVTDPNNLKTKAENYVTTSVNQNITIEVTTIDLHLIDPTIESLNVCEYIQVLSTPHNFDSILLCNKQTLDILKPDNDTYTLGYTYSTFTESSSKMASAVSSVVKIQSTVNNLSNRLTVVDKTAEEALNDYQEISQEMSTFSGDLEAIAGAVTDNARNIATNASNIATNTQDIEDLRNAFEGAGVIADDYIVETGTNGIWTYEKWSSGKVKCWGVCNVVFSGDGTSAGLDGIKLYATDVSVPSFIVRGSIIPHCDCAWSFSEWVQCAESNEGKIRIRAFSCSSNFINNNSRALTCTFDVTAKWK